jgi:Arc/MetJ family transcription regulator
MWNCYTCELLSASELGPLYRGAILVIGTFCQTAVPVRRLIIAVRGALSPDSLHNGKGLGINISIKWCTIGCCLFSVGEENMRTTVNIDDQLMSEAQRITGVSEKAALVREGLKALIERESSRRLAKLGATDPELKPVPRSSTGKI